MIPAAKSAFFTWWLSGDAEKRLRRTFGLITVRGLDELRGMLARGPVLVLSNHSSWWDPIVVQVLCHRVLRADAFALMDAKNLRLLPFFRKVGAFGVDLDDPADGARVIRHSVKLLDRPGRLVWIFPQGREMPLGQRPLGFRPGTAAVARLARKAVVVPCAIHYAFGAEELPELRISFGGAIDGDHEAAVTRELDGILSPDSSELVMHRRGPSWVFQAASKVLAGLTR